KLPHVIDGLVERDVDGLAAPHCLIKGNSDQKSGFADAVAGNDDSNVPRSKAPVNRVLEQSRRVAFVEFLAIHVDSSFYSSPIPRQRGSSRCRPSFCI